MNAIATSRGKPLGSFIASFDVSHGGNIHWQQSGRAGHYDLTGPAADMLAGLVSVVPI
jgi:hypothetical protein